MALIKDTIEDNNKDEQAWASCAKLRFRSSFKLDQPEGYLDCTNTI